MTVVQTLLVYVGVPALGFAVVAALVFAGGSGRGARYRPGRGWNHEDVWYLPRPATANGHSTPQLTAGATSFENSARTARGGASGTW